MRVREEIFGLLGPNGAGKSTLVKIIMSVVRPTEADGLVMNHAVGSKSSLVKCRLPCRSITSRRGCLPGARRRFSRRLSNVARPIAATACCSNSLKPSA